MALTAPATAPTLHETLHDFVQGAERDFPRLKGRLALIDVTTMRYYTTAAFTPQRHKFKSQRGLNRFFNRHATAEECRDPKNPVRAMAEHDAARDLYIIFFNQNERGLDKPLTPAALRNVMHTLDHELGHIAIRDGLYASEDSKHNALMSENIAETYAILRHYQRFGADRRQELHSSPREMADSFIFNHASYATHFYLFAEQEIEKRRAVIDFAALSPAQTADLARRFALQFSPSDAMVDELNRIFAPCRAAYRKGAKDPSHPWLRVLGDVTLKTNSPFAARLGLDVLLGYLERPSFKANGKWDGLREAAKQMEFRLAQEEMLYGLPQLAPKAAPSPQRPRP